MDKEKSLLDIRNLKVYYPIKTGVFKRTTGYVKAVDDLSLTVYKGETLGLVGESGCGKTTLCKALVMLNQPKEGTITYHAPEGDIDLRTKKKDQIRAARKYIQYVFQDPQSSLNPSKTVFGSMDDALKIRGIKSKQERRKIVQDLLEAVNMRPDQLDNFPNEFSGGQRQRIGIARALCVSPELVICDEAVSALDVSIQAQVLNLLQELKEKRNLTYVFITHDLSVVEYISDRIAVMYLGHIVELADTEALFAHMYHPYTRALRSAVPVADVNVKKERIVLTGDVPNPANPPKGCPFHPRCWECTGKCMEEMPQLKNYLVDGKPYSVACHKAHEQLKDMEIKEDLL